MIIEYEKKYDEEIKDLLVELQEYIAALDKEGFNILTPEYREKYFEATMEEVQKSDGKILLYEQDGKIVGLVVGIILESVSRYDFVTPKRGRVTELVISKNYRKRGYGKLLLDAMEKYFMEVGCKNIIIAAFGYNYGAIDFYQQNGYRARLVDLTKNI